MSTSKLERTYKCWNDCEMGGCPSHIATLEFQSTSDAFHFKDGKRQELFGQTPEFGALVSMLNELAVFRVEVESMLNESAPTKSGE